MKLDPIKFNTHHWNLDGLKPSKPKAEGKRSTIAFNDKFGPLLRAVAVNLPGDEEKIFILRGKKQMIIQSFALGSPKTQTVVKSWAKKEIVDIAVAEGFLYVLDRTSNRVESLPLNPKDDTSPRFWNIGSIGLTPHSRLALVQNAPNDSSLTAYVAGGREGRLFTVLLDKIGDRSRISEIEVSIPAAPTTLGKELYLCPDPQKKTLLVSDTSHHRILELKINGTDRATAEILCGTGLMGTPEEGGIAAGAPLSSPKALALYRHQEAISEELIHKHLRAVFSYDPGVRPRTILFIDSGSSSVKKLIDFPQQVEEFHETTSGMVIHTLLGLRRRSLGSFLTGGREDDLRSIAVSKPVDLVVTAAGELLVASENPSSLLLLRPATSMEEQTVQTKARNSNIDFLS